MTTITSLPDEVIDIILKNKSISIVDIVSFLTTCKRFYRIAQSNKLWETKFYQRSSSANKKYNNNYNIEKRKKISEKIDFKKEIETGIKCINKLRYYHSLMCINNFWKSEASELYHLLCSTATKSMVYYFVIDELFRISQLSGHPDLISTYYLGIIFRCLKQRRFAYKLNKFNSKPIEKQLFEKLLIIIAQYFQPHLSYSGIKTWLDDIELEVLIRLRKQYPMHSIFSISLEQSSFWKDNNIEDNFWDQTEAKQIMHVLEKFIFAELENYKLHQFWKTLNLEDKYISGNIQKYLLIITYHIVARRLGIRCNLASYYEPNNQFHLKILWIPKYHAGNNTLILPFYPNFDKIKFHGIRNLDNAEYLFLDVESYLPYPLNIVKEKLRGNERETMRYIKWNNAVEWNDLIKNITLKILRLFYRQQMRNKPDCSWEYNIIIDIMTYPKIQKPNIADFVMESHQVSDNIYFLTRSQRKRRKIIKKRNDEMRFAVGMIVTHSSQIIVRNELFDERYNGYSLDNYINNEYRLTNNHDGVIVGWDNLHINDYTSSCPHLKKNPCNDRCRCRCTQLWGTKLHYIIKLHYKILSENNIICYVSEDKISICPPKEINNIEIGRFFSKFEGTHYVLNEWLAKLYPEDTTALSKILSNQ